MKFKVGDEVRIESRKDILYGEVGKVTEVMPGNYCPYRVTFDDVEGFPSHMLSGVYGEGDLASSRSISVGDRVAVHEKYYDGEIGTVIRIDLLNLPYPYVVRFDGEEGGDEVDIFNGDDLEIVEDSDPEPPVTGVKDGRFSVNLSTSVEAMQVLAVVLGSVVVVNDESESLSNLLTELLKCTGDPETFFNEAVAKYEINFQQESYYIGEPDEPWRSWSIRPVKELIDDLQDRNSYLTSQLGIERGKVADLLNLVGWVDDLARAISDVSNTTVSGINKIDEGGSESE